MLISLRKHLRSVLYILVSAALLGAALYLVGIQTSLSALAGLKLEAGLVALLLILGNTFFVFLRFRSVLKNFGYRPNWSTSALAFIAGQISNQILLNVVGQSLSRAATLQAAKIPFGVSVVTTYWERVLAAGLLFLFALIAAFFLFLDIGIELRDGSAYLISIIAAIAIVSAVIFSAHFANPGFRSKLWGLPRRILRFWPAILLTVAAHLSMLLAYVVLLVALEPHPVSAGLICAVTIVMFSASLPISFSGWGVRELSAAHALAFVGFSSSTAIAAALAIGLLGLLITACGGVIALFLFAHMHLRNKAVAPADIRDAILVDQDQWLGIAVIFAGIATAVLLFFQIQIPTANGGITANIADILALTGLGLFLLLLLRRRSVFPLQGWLIISMAALSALILLGIISGYLRFGSNNWALFNRGFGWLVILGYVSLGAMLALIPQRGVEKKLLQAFALAGVTVAAIQITLMFCSLLIIPLPREVFSTPMKAYATNSNSFAIQMVLTGISIVIASRIRLMSLRPIVYTGALAIILVAIFYTYSRVGMAMMAVLIVFMLVFASPDERRQGYKTTAILGLIYLFLLFFPSIIAAVTSSLPSDALSINSEVYPANPLEMSRAYSDNERWVTLIESWSLWLEHPVLGAGIGAYIQGRLDAGLGVLVIHSVPLWLLAETGVIGLLIATAALAAITRAAFLTMKDPATRAWGLGFLIMLTCITAASLVHDLFFQRPFWFLLGLFSAVAARNASSAQLQRV